MQLVLALNAQFNAVKRESGGRALSHQSVPSLSCPRNGQADGDFGSPAGVINPLVGFGKRCWVSVLLKWLGRKHLPFPSARIPANVWLHVPVFSSNQDLRFFAKSDAGKHLPGSVYS
jgi:hypothetical protein